MVPVGKLKPRIYVVVAQMAPGETLRSTYDKLVHRPVVDKVVSWANIVQVADTVQVADKAQPEGTSGVVKQTPSGTNGLFADKMREVQGMSLNDASRLRYCLIDEVGAGQLMAQLASDINHVLLRLFTANPDELSKQVHYFAEFMSFCRKIGLDDLCVVIDGYRGRFVYRAARPVKFTVAESFHPSRALRQVVNSLVCANTHTGIRFSFPKIRGLATSRTR